MAAIIPAAAIGGAIGAELPKFFDDAFDQFGAGEGIYLRDGQPSGVVAKIGQAVGRGYCRAYDSVSGQYEPGKATRIEKACRPYLDSIGSPGGPGLELPYRGAQCEVKYRFEYTGTGPTGIQGGVNCVGSQNIVGAAELWGPVTQFGLGASKCAGGPGGGGKALTITSFGFASGPRRTTPLTQEIGGTFYTLTVTSVTRLDGQQDNCGNPPPTPTVPPPPVNPQPPPFRFNPGPGIDIDIDVEIGPTGDITFDIGTGPITVDPFLPSPDDPGGPGGDGGDPGDPTDPGTPGTPDDTGGGGAADGEAGPGEELVGLLVEVLESPQGANVFANNVAQPFRGIGYVRMGYPGRLGLDISGGTVISPQFFHAQQRGLTNWAVSANLGFNLRTTPYYRSITP